MKAQRLPTAPTAPRFAALAMLCAALLFGMGIALAEPAPPAKKTDATTTAEATGTAAKAAAPTGTTPKTTPTGKTATENTTAAKTATEPKPKASAEAPGTDTAAKEEAASEKAQGRYTALVARMTLKVRSPEETRAAIEAELSSLGGFPVLVTDTVVELKVPPRHLSGLLDFVAEQGLLVDKALERADLTLQVNELEGQLKSKRAILAELRGFFDRSDVAATLQIERSMTELVEELERVKGALRVMDDRSRWALVHVSFQFRERQRITSVKSQFEWLNDVSLERFLETF